MEEGARIHVNGCGHPGCRNGAGHGKGGGEGGIYCAGGGSYRTRGGIGKCSVDKQQKEALSGSTYGGGRLRIKDKLPLGSAGGALFFMKVKPKHSLPGAAGGGALSITIDGTLQLGKKSGFQANGQDGSWSTGGAGSGGTLMLVCKGTIEMPNGPTNLLAVVGGQSLGRYQQARGSGGMGYVHLDYQYTVAPQIKLPHGLACWLKYWMRQSNIKEQNLLFGWIALFVGDSDECFLDQLSQEIANNPYVDNTLPNSNGVYTDYLYEAGQHAHQQKKHGQAIRYYGQAIENITQQRHANDAPSTITEKGCYLKIAEAYVAQRNYPKAVKAYQKAGQKAKSMEEALNQLQRAQQKEIEMDYITQQGLSLYIPLQAADRPTDDLNDKTPSFPLADYITAFTGEGLIDKGHQDRDDTKDDEKKENNNNDDILQLLNKRIFKYEDSGLADSLDNNLLPQELKERLKKNRILLLQGASGAGKSLAGRYMTTQYKGRRKDKKGTWLAVFISLPTTYGGADLLTKALVEKGVDILSIHALQQSESVRILFVLDGFDEIITSYLKHAHLPDKLHERFEFDQWPSSKFIISCRSQGITDSGKNQYLGSHPEVHLIPFTEQQIEQYITAFAKNNKLNIAGWEAAQYREALAKFPGLTAMTREPFSLGLILNVLPNLKHEKGSKISRAELYEAFTEQWFQRQITKLKQNEKINVPTATLQQNFQTYCEELALAMFKSGQQVADAGQESDVWHTFFTQEKRLSLQSSPLRKVGTKRYMFIHKSYQEYFVATRFIDNLLDLLKYQSQWSTYDFTAVDWNQKSYQQFFNEDPAVVGFMIDRLHDTAKPYSQLEKLLFALIEYSKKSKQVAILSANSATLLCAARILLSNQQWAGIRIPHAKLDEAFLVGSDLSHSDCTAVSLRQAYVERTTWQGAQVHDINFWEYPYLQHDDAVNVAVYSPDGRYIASASDDKTVRIWDATTGHPIVIGKGHASIVYSVDWAQDSRRIASASKDNTVRIWDANTGQSIATCTGHTDYVNSVAWAQDRQDSRLIASASDDNTVRIWDATTGKSFAICTGHIKGVSSVAWAPDSGLIASASRDKTVRIWDATTGKPIATCIGHTKGVSSVAWAPDNGLIASASRDKTVRIWDPKNGKKMATCSGHTSFVKSVAWAPDNSLIASASRDKTVRIWDPKNGNNIAICNGHTDYVNSVAWATDNRFVASASDDKTVRIWDPKNGNNIATCIGHSHWVLSVAWLPDNSSIASASKDKTVRIWDHKNSNNIAIRSGHTDYITSVAWAPDNKLIASASDDKTVRIWDPKSGDNIATCSGHADYITSMAWAPDNELIASASRDKTVCIWDPKNGNKIATCEGHTDYVNSVAWAPDNKFIASASDDKTVRIWDPKNGNKIATCAGHTDYVTSVAWALDNKFIASASDDNTVRIWDARNGKPIATCRGHTSYVNSVAWAPNSRRITSASKDHTVRVWDATTGNPIITCSGHTDYITSVAWAQDSGKIASASSDRTVRIWDARNGKAISTCKGHINQITSMAWLRESSKIATTSFDKTVRIWDAQNGKAIATCYGHTSYVKSVAWAPNGRSIASASDDKTVRIWDARNGHISCIIGMEHVQLSLTGACFAGAIGLSDLNKRLIQQRGGSIEDKKNAAPKDSTTDTLDNEKKDDV